MSYSRACCLRHGMRHVTLVRSLQLNSVGLYQILKICTTPTIVLIEFFGYGKTTPPDRLAALALICIGAAAVTVSDVDIRLLGLCAGILGVLVTSFYQVKRAVAAVPLSD